MKNRGISLIVLIVTIIVIIILAAVVILTLSKNNPIESAKEARFKEDIRTFQDELAMYISKDYTAKSGQREDKINATNYEPAGDPESVYTYIPSFSKKYEGKFGIINDEFIYIEKNLTEKEKDWVISLKLQIGKNIVPTEWKPYISSITDDGVPIPKGFTYKEGTKEAGVVIEDSAHNEFVWIPVDNIVDYKKNTTYLEDLNSSVTNENLDVEKYHGFYIGRYEATTPNGEEDTKKDSIGIPTCKKGKVIWTNISYNKAKPSSESMYTGEESSVQSGLLTGKAWDTTCKWIEDYIKTLNTSSTLNNSRFYGNYSDSQSPANVLGAGSRQVSGFSDKWSAKNIYDLAGSVWEWTYEKDNSNNILRGGSFKNNNIVLHRFSRSVYDIIDDFGFRIRLYIKTE